MNKKKVLITGGNGFLGRNLAIALKSEYDVILGSRNNKLNFEAARLTDCESVPLDVSNIESVRDVVNQFKPNIIIHAAATKFVDLAERYPSECVDINVLGSQNVARVAVDSGVETVIGISTDKASPPIRNIYGMSKSIMERLFSSLDAKSFTKFTCVRYGNVTWSTGSVFPIWEDKNMNNQPVGITSPEMRRFFFTVDEAVALVITAINNIDLIRGKVLSREMKAACMKDVLSAWLKVKGGKVEAINTRPGERMDEYLVGEAELLSTEEIILNQIKHYLISFNGVTNKPISTVVDTVSASKLTENEIINLIESKPKV